jgi:anti-sigma regulatory factor (Ser/Thr protein kinase)
LVLQWQESWPARPEHVGAARRAAAAAAREAGAAPSVRDGVRIAVTEAVGNAVLHGYSESPAGSVTVRVEADGDALHVIVRDDGCGMRPRMDSPGAGLGLPLMAKVAETMSVGNAPGGGTEVHMTFPLREPVPA